MATFLVRAYETATGTTLSASQDYFDDDEGLNHEANINKAAEAGFATGTGERTYSPGANVRRAPMGSFLARVLDVFVENGFAEPPAGQAMSTYTDVVTFDFDINAPVTWGTDVVMGADGPIVAYHHPNEDGTSGLGLVVCHDVTCSDATAQILDTGLTHDGRWPSIALTSDGVPVIAHVNDTSQAAESPSPPRPYLTYCDDAACSGSSTVLLDEGTNLSPPPEFGDYRGLGPWTSLALDADDRPIVAYHARWSEATQAAMARCNDTACTDVTYNLFGPVDAGQNMDMVLSADGNPVVVHVNGGDSHFYRSVCDDPACSSSTDTLFAGADLGEQQHAAITLGGNGFPILLYHETGEVGISVAPCTDLSNCPEHPLEGDIQRYGYWVDVTADADGFAMGAYHDSTGGVRLFDCDDQNCTDVVPVTVEDSSDDEGQWISITAGPDGEPILAYFDMAQQALTVARIVG